MSELVVSLFRDQQRAPEVLNELRRSEHQWTDELNHALAVTLDLCGHIKVQMSVDLTGRETGSWITMWSSLLAGALFIPGAHVLVEAAEEIAGSKNNNCHPTRQLTVAQELKWWRDSIRLSDDFRRDLAAALSSGGSAIFMLFPLNRAADVLPQLRTYGGDIIVHTTLNNEQDQQLAQLIGLELTNTESLAQQIP